MIILQMLGRDASKAVTPREVRRLHRFEPVEKYEMRVDLRWTGQGPRGTAA
ncbi:MAG: hypothetical protein ABNH38_11120 [Tateyamaria sp.]|uniref:hypothetical protein n=1 Tax=unclassified Tateyamaria TaxID=2645127 RepID=UPI00131F24C5|nr:hypothetical protein [Tateyamaria sp. Alg231-49]